MKLLTMPKGQDRCILYSLAMLLDEDPELLVDEMGVNDMEEVSYGLRSLHIQECIDVCWDRGYVLMPISRLLLMGTQDDHIHAMHPEAAWLRFLGYVIGHPGIMEYPEIKHITAWDGHDIYDPKGDIYTLDKAVMKPSTCWIRLSYQ